MFLVVGPPMSAPRSFTWIKRPLLAALARPTSAEELAWLRKHGIQLLLSLTEDPPRRDWVNDAGLMTFHEPIVDMTAPSQGQIDRCLSVIERAHEQSMGVAVHCAAGLGRTGTIIAAYLVSQGATAAEAMDRIRHLRPGSIETQDQAEAVEEFARRQAKLKS